jgi:predicted negative regulator of RcsB-dependent stress response
MIGIALARLKTWAKSPNVWLLVVIAGMGAVIYFGNQRLQERKAAAAKSEAIATGATDTVKAAVETAKAAQEAEASTPLPADKAAIIELCRKSASCRERGQR